MCCYGLLCCVRNWLSCDVNVLLLCVLNGVGLFVLMLVLCNWFIIVCVDRCFLMFLWLN